MRVAFNATSLLSPLTGIGHYCRELAERLAALPETDAQFFFGAMWSRTVRSAPLPGAGRVLPWLRSHIPHSYALRRAIQGNRFTRYARSQRFDLYHEPNILPLPFEGPTLITVHDISWVRHPAAHPQERVKAMNRHFPKALSTASKIITDSRFVRQELIEEFAMDPCKIVVVPLGVDRIFQPLTSEQTHSVRQSRNLTHGHYFMTVGTLEPRKNLKTALEAFLLLPGAIRQRYPLLLAGMPGWNNQELSQMIQALEQTGEVRRLGYLPRTELSQLLAGATALIYPSVYEGFGLPPLEAMACGVPVISSNAASLPEVVGDSGALLDPFDTEGISHAMLSMVEDPAFRDATSIAGLERSAGFTWEACFQGTLQTYRKVLAS